MLKKYKCEMCTLEEQKNYIDDRLYNLFVFCLMYKDMDKDFILQSFNDFILKTKRNKKGFKDIEFKIENVDQEVKIEILKVLTRNRDSKITNKFPELLGSTFSDDDIFDLITFALMRRGNTKKDA